MKEIWRDIQGFEGLYEISDYGNARNKITGKVLKHEYHYRGYLRIQIFKDRKKHNLFVHRVVAIAFLPNLESKEYVNHIDRNKKNNWIKNLEWVTPTENSMHWIQDDRTRIESAASLIPF